MVEYSIFAFFFFTEQSAFVLRDSEPLWDVLFMFGHITYVMPSNLISYKMSLQQFLSVPLIFPAFLLLKSQAIKFMSSYFSRHGKMSHSQHLMFSVVHGVNKKYTVPRHPWKLGCKPTLNWGCEVTVLSRSELVTAWGCGLSKHLILMEIWKCWELSVTTWAGSTVSHWSM